MFVLAKDGQVSSVSRDNGFQKSTNDLKIVLHLQPPDVIIHYLYCCFLLSCCTTGWEIFRSVWR